MKYKKLSILLPIYLMILVLLLASAIGSSYAVNTINENINIPINRRIIIDPGHGGIDGGASAAGGILESNINLQIGLRLNDLLHLLGIHTVMVRTEDISVYTSGETIAAKKVSDLKERVRLVNQTDNGILVSIHQNHFTDSRYRGAQVFYADTTGSQDLARKMQSAMVTNLNPGSNRKAKKATGIYLMQNIQCTGILVECGFLSNPAEAQLLTDKNYQNNLCSVIASVISSELYARSIT